MPYIIITFVIVKENNVMTQNTTYRTTLNGANWMIIGLTSKFPWQGAELAKDRGLS